MENKNIAINNKPPFSLRLKNFIYALVEYLRYCIRPKPVDCLGQKVVKPDWHLAFTKIERPPVKDNESAFEMRDRHCAQIVMTNAKLKSLKWTYRWHKKKCAKDLREKARAAFVELIR